MKKSLPVLVLAALLPLGGCVVYDDGGTQGPYNGAYDYYDPDYAYGGYREPPPPYFAPAPVPYAPPAYVTPTPDMRPHYHGPHGIPYSLYREYY